MIEKLSSSDFEAGLERSLLKMLSRKATDDVESMVGVMWNKLGNAHDLSKLFLPTPGFTLFAFRKIPKP